MRMRSVLMALMPFASPALPATLPEIPEEFRDAPAVVLEDRRSWEIFPRSYAEYKVKQRILVTDPRGFDAADQLIVYDAHDSEISSLRARTVLLNGEVVDVTEDLKHDSELFKSEEVEWRSLQFTFPAVSPGAILELDYHLH